MRKESTGPICLVQQPNKTQKEQHRIAVHRGNVGQEIDDDDFQVDPLPLYDVVGEEAVRILGKKNELYLVKFENDLVIEFEEECEEKTDDSNKQLAIIINDMIQDWMANELPEEIVIEEDIFDYELL